MLFIYWLYLRNKFPHLLSDCQLTHTCIQS